MASYVETSHQHHSVRPADAGQNPCRPEWQVSLTAYVFVLAILMSDGIMKVI
jgi:hypothetical protein